jgi:hypothetical protein
MYRFVHPCRNIADPAPKMLLTPLKNQSEFTQMAHGGGENVGGEAKVNEADDVWDAFGGLARSR